MLIFGVLEEEVNLVMDNEKKTFVEQEINQEGVEVKDERRKKFKNGN